MTAWKTLIKLHANGQPICNCGQAYLTPCGVAFVDGKLRGDYLTCRGGCSSAQIYAKEYVAEQILGG